MLALIRVLCKCECWRQAWRLSGVTAAGQTRKEVEREWALKLIHRKHPLDALAHCRTNLERHCIMRLVLTETDTTLPHSGLMMAHMITGLGDLNAIYCDKMETTLKAMGERTPYTYQLVQRVKARPDEKRATAGGEVARRVFICFGSASCALDFSQAWLSAQRQSLQNNSGEATCLLECGTYDATLRKWVLDVDASVAELKKDPLLWPASMDETHIRADLHAKTMAMAMAVAQSLFELGFLYRPCHFSVTSRHSAKKLSWHITLNALASHERWRQAIGALERKCRDKLGRIYDFVDKGTKNNSKSQYMQVWGSTKVAPGVKADGNCFKDVGVFDAGGVQVDVPASRYAILFYAATSVVVHDPWSLPFIAPEPPPAPPTPKKAVGEPRRSRPQTLPSAGLTSWSAVPERECVWIKGLVERKDGATRLVSIPSMANPQHWCDSVVRLVNAGRGVLRVYAKVLNPALCPKYLKASQRIHQHGSNHCMLAVVEETHPSCKATSFRVFMRCFSDKCRALKSPHCSACGWVELGRPDFLVARVLKSKQ